MTLFNGGAKDGKKKNEISIRSSAAEYLTYVASVGEQEDSVQMCYEDENIWLTQKNDGYILHFTGYTPENIEEPLIREICHLDKLVDELAKGKAMEKILRKRRQL